MAKSAHRPQKRRPTRLSITTARAVILLAGLGASTLLPTVFSTPAALAQSSAAADEDPAFWWKQQGWLTNFEKANVKFNEILSGGPPKDGIPSIDDPQFKPIADITDISDEEPVIGLIINGDERAYPLSVLTWHEIVNDTVGGTPVAVTYCPLCNAALVFERRLNGKAVEFGTTGKLRRSDLIMYDRDTESWWQQFSGEAIVGDAVGMKLKLVPSRLESFANFKKRAPDGKVLVPTNPKMRRYGENPYVGYDSSNVPFLFRGELPKYIPAMERVVVVRRDNEAPLIVSMQHVRDQGSFERDGVMLSWSAGQTSALDSADIAKGRDVGNIVAQTQVDGKAEDVPYDVTFAFVAHSFHPDVRIIQN